MSTATATPLQAIRDAQDTITGMIPRRENMMGNRFAWYGLDNVHHLDLDAMTNGANGGLLRRCKWQPITKAQRWVHINALGDNGAAMIVARRNPDPTSGRQREAMYWVTPAAIQNSLMMLYAERGMVDSGVLKYAELDLFEKLQLDDLFFPENEASLPRTFKACEARVVGQLRRLQKGECFTPEWHDLTEPNEAKAARPSQPLPIPPALVSSVIKIGEEMLQSLRQSATFGRREIDQRHAEMEKAATDTTGRYRGTYDNRERRLLEWLEITPRNQALEKIALDSNQLPQVITQMAQVVAAQANRPSEAMDVSALGAAIGASLAKELAPLMARQEAKAEPAKSETPTEQPEVRKAGPSLPVKKS